MKISRLLKLAIKISFICLAFSIIFHKVNISDVATILKSARLEFLLIAFLLFNLSQFFSSIRANTYFRAISVYLSNKMSAKLYYIGMFYNIFLPGGIGGDGYKVYKLNKLFGTKYKSIILSVLIDRLNGFLAILVIVAFLGLFLLDYHVLSLLFIVLIILLNYSLHRYIFSIFRFCFLKTSLMSIVIQVFQLIVAFFILFSLCSYDFIYIFIFLISSMCSVLPISVGGVGIRELVFLYGSSYFGLDPKIGVSLALIFFFITLTSSLIGGLLKLNKSK